MTLWLVEVVVPESRVQSDAFAGRARAAVEGAARVVETTFASDWSRLYVIVEGANADVLTARLRDADVRVADIAPVRLVGEAPREDAPAPSHLVEWDLPAELKIDQYLKRKAEKTPLYAKVPEVHFLRTYVREDMIKCVCLYDAPDEEAVRRARDAVGAPVDRLSRVAPPSDED
ncbi:MAG TPA: DUF4242 domain-containing protein [Polyangiaceae bacterium]|jgi:hypothetical protein|nr:DUF4242 domain-containing protein [Polyangiaceae bacterium]